MGTLAGSYAHVAAMPGIKGVMLTFDDFLIAWMLLVSASGR
jgi:hypothetical protein